MRAEAVAVLGDLRRRVVVLDDDEIVRAGRCSAFRDAEDFELLGCGPTSRASAWPDAWRGAEVVVVEAYHPYGAFDRFVGVDVVERLRAEDFVVRPTVVVVGLDADNPYLSLRLAEAGADHLYRRRDVGTVADLLAAVRTPDLGCRPDRRDACERIPGLSGPTKVNDVLRDLVAMGLTAAFEPGTPQRESGFSRRQHINARSLVHERAQLSADVNRRTGGVQDRGFVPSWREVVDFVNRARGFELRTAAA